ncbi:MAG: hypothetical protein JSV80_08595 [Acidobacteriota bacterium]|nr:MAG: hypothetical protein JSV80_08595 [Acidobacteriota bacterium]
MRRAVNGARGLTLGGAALAALLAIGAAPAERFPIEAAGPADAVRAAVSASGHSAGVLVWPPAHVLEAGDLPPGTVLVALQALCGELIAAEGGPSAARPLFRAYADRTVAGFVLERARQDRLVALLSRLADLPAVPARRLESELATALERLGEQWRQPVRRARMALERLAVGAGTGPALAAGTPATLARIRSSDLNEALERLRASAVEARGVGSRGLAREMALALSSRLGKPTARGVSPASPASSLEPAALIDARELAETGIVVGYLFGPELAAVHGGRIALLAEALSEGNGSLAQRLAVARGAPPASRGASSIGSNVEVVSLGSRGGVLLMRARTPTEQAAAAWKVIEGTINSIRSLRLAEPAVLRARQRLDARAQSIESDAARLLLERVVPEPAWAWPPESRWQRPPTAVELLATAQALTGEEQRLIAVAGPALGPLGELISPSRIVAADDFCPDQPTGLCRPGPPPPPARAEADPAPRLALEVLNALGGDRVQAVPVTFSARYRIEQHTPLGPAVSMLELRGDDQRVSMRLEGEDWTLELDTDAQVIVTEKSNGSRVGTDLEQIDRIESAAYLQPALLAAAVQSGILPGSQREVSCSDGRCPALETALPEGRRVQLVLDPARTVVLERRTWWRAREQGRAADEIVRYLAWRIIDGIRLATSFDVSSYGEPVRRWTLEAWSWTADFDSHGAERAGGAGG